MTLNTECAKSLIQQTGFLRLDNADTPSQMWKKNAVYVFAIFFVENPNYTVAISSRWICLTAHRQADRHTDMHACMHLIKNDKSQNHPICELRLNSHHM